MIDHHSALRLRLTGDVRPEMLDNITPKPPETLDLDRRCSTGDVGQNSLEPTMTERIAALSARYTADDAPTYPSDYDPLCDL